MRLLPLSNGMWAKVDDQDFMFCLAYNWTLKSDGYAHAYVKGSGRKNQKHIVLHKLIADRMHLDCASKEIDHKDRNRLNCQRDNLRVATGSQNRANRKLSSQNKSGVQGVWWNVARNKWQSAVVVNRKSHYIGLFNTIEAAETAYLAARKKHFGEFA